MPDIVDQRATEAIRQMTIVHKNEEGIDLSENAMVGGAVILFQCIDKDSGEESMYIGYSSGTSWILAEGLLSLGASAISI